MVFLATNSVRRSTFGVLGLIPLFGSALLALAAIPVYASGSVPSMEPDRLGMQLACGGGGNGAERKPARPGAKTNPHVHG